MAATAAARAAVVCALYLNASSSPPGSLFFGRVDTATGAVSDSFEAVTAAAGERLRAGDVAGGARGASDVWLALEDGGEAILAVNAANRSAGRRAVAAPPGRRGAFSVLHLAGDSGGAGAAALLVAADASWAVLADIASAASSVELADLSAAYLHGGLDVAGGGAAAIDWRSRFVWLSARNSSVGCALDGSPAPVVFPMPFKQRVAAVRWSILFDDPNSGGPGIVALAGDEASGAVTLFGSFVPGSGGFDWFEVVAYNASVALGAAAAAVEGPDGGSSLMFLGLKDAASGAALVSVVDLMKNAEVSRVALPAELSLVELVACA